MGPTDDLFYSKPSPNLLTREEEQELGRRSRLGDVEARNELVTRNLALVVSIVLKFKSYGVDLQDLVSRANLALIRAAEKFDPDRGCKFSTYATFWIKQGIYNAIAESGAEVRIPRDAYELGRYVAKRFKDRPLNVQDIVKELGMDHKDAIKAYDALRAVNRQKDQTAFMEMESTSSGEQDAMEANELLPLLLVELNEREKKIISKRFGFDGKAMTLKDIGDEQGVCKERIRQLETKALEKMRKKLATLK